MSSLYSNSSSAPLKKRNRIHASNSDSESSTQTSDEQAAAKALAELNRSPSNNSGNVSDADSVSSNGSSSSIPKAVHKPPVSSMMVDHTYTDYSVVKEELLSYLNNDDDNDSDSEMSDDERKVKEKALKKIRKIFGDISPTRKNSGGVVKPFPEKLMEVLDRGDMDNIITWLPHGRAFIVRHAQQLREVVLPRFFKQSKFMSFTRQLNLWGFKRITKGTDAGAYYHELFLRSRPLLSMLMRRQKIKGTGIKLTPNPETEPNFYSISKKRPLPLISMDKNKLQPLPPLSSTVSITRNAKQNSSPNNLTFSNSNVQQNVDFFMQQQLEQQQNRINDFSRDQLQLKHQSPSHLGGGRMLPGLTQQRLSYQDPYAKLDMLQQESHVPYQRLSAPTSQADINLVADSFQQKRRMEQQAIASAQNLLQEVGGRQPPIANPVEDLKQKLLNAVQSLEQAQTPQTMDHQNHFQSNLLGSFRRQNNGQQGHPSLSQYQPMMQSNNYMQHQQQQQQHNMYHPQQQHQHHFLGQNLPQVEQPQNRTSLAALMSALDQTRQVADAAIAQSSLLQQVAHDFALNRRSSK